MPAFTLAIETELYLIAIKLILQYKQFVYAGVLTVPHLTDLQLCR